jgi:hypothetical protein
MPCFCVASLPVLVLRPNLPSRLLFRRLARYSRLHVLYRYLLELGYFIFSLYLYRSLLRGAVLCLFRSQHPTGTPSIHPTRYTWTHWRLKQSIISLRNGSEVNALIKLRTACFKDLDNREAHQETALQRVAKFATIVF